MKGLSGKEWVLLSEMIKPEEDAVPELGDVVAQILANRGKDQSILDLRLKRLLPPHRIPNIVLAVERIKKAIDRRERIVLFGDYDVDGITGTALLYRFLKNFPITVVPLLPSRQSGYGLNKRLVDKLSHYTELNKPDNSFLRHKVFGVRAEGSDKGLRNKSPFGKVGTQRNNNLKGYNLFFGAKDKRTRQGLKTLHSPKAVPDGGSR
jgi:hypothetical protein